MSKFLIDDYAIPQSLQNIIDRVNDDEELTQTEAQEWLAYYLYIITAKYTLTVKEMLTEHDRWLKCIEYYSGIDEAKMNEFYDRDYKRSNISLDEFLKIIVNYFTIDELKYIGFD